jgi:hypothetical protein
MARTKKPPTPLESEVQRNGILHLESRGWVCYRRNVAGWAIPETETSDRRFISANKAGMSDTWGRLPDRRRFELEFKRHGKRPTEKQIAWLRENNDEHCVAFWVDNLATLQIVAAHLMAGGSVEYSEHPGADRDYYQLT